MHVSMFPDDDNENVKIVSVMLDDEESMVQFMDVQSLQVSDTCLKHNMSQLHTHTHPPIISYDQSMDFIIKVFLNTWTVYIL